MEDKKFLKETDLAQVTGGADEGYDPGGHKCPTCGSKRVKFIGEVANAARFECKDCGCTFLSDS